MLAQAFAAWLMTVATSRGVGEGISCLPPWKHKHCVEKKALALHCSSPHFNPHAKHSATTWMTNHEEMQPGASASRGVSSSWGHRAASCSALGLTSPRILKKVFPLGIFTNANISSLFAICIFFRRKVYLTFFFFLCSPALLLHSFWASTRRKREVGAGVAAPQWGQHMDTAELSKNVLL